VVDIEVQAVEGAAQTGKLIDALAAGDKVDANDNAFSGSFPYVALPNVGAVNKGGGTGGGATASGGNGNGGAGNGANPGATPGPGDPSTTPAGFASRDSGTSSAVAVGASAVAIALAVLLFVGWWRRRRPTTRVAGHAARGSSRAGSGDDPDDQAFSL
jgi:hypothetical protein